MVVCEQMIISGYHTVMEFPHNRNPVPLVFGFSFILAAAAALFTFNYAVSTELTSDIIALLLLLNLSFIGLISVITVNIIAGIMGFYYTRKAVWFEQQSRAHRQRTQDLLCRYPYESPAGRRR